MYAQGLIAVRNPFFFMRNKNIFVQVFGVD